MMRHRVAWVDHDQTILQQTYLSGASAEDFYAVVDHTRQLMAQADHPVDLIVELSQMADLQSYRFFATARYVDRLVPSNQRVVVLVGASQVMKAFARMVNRFIRHGNSRLSFANITSDALAVIYAYRAQAAAETPAPAP